MDVADIPDDTPVVRGGSNRDKRALLGALTAMKKPVLSVFIAPEVEDWDTSVAVACAEGPIVHGKVQVGAAADIRSSGLVIADERDPDESERHFHVYFPHPVTESSVQAWLDATSEPMPNPAKEQS